MPLLPLIPVVIVISIGLVIARSVQKARKRDAAFVKNADEKQ